MFTNLNRESLIGLIDLKLYRRVHMLMHVFLDRPQSLFYLVMKNVFPNSCLAHIFYIGNLPPALTQGVDWVALAANELRF